MDVARHNVLTYYGLGGIGKTALSERLEAWVRRRLPLDNGWGITPAMDRASSVSGSIGFRYAFAACADALVTNDHERLDLIRAATEAMVFRTRSWIPVGCFLTVAGRAPSPQPTEWLEDPEVVRQRWADHLATYLARHHR